MNTNFYKAAKNTTNQAKVFFTGSVDSVLLNQNQNERVFVVKQTLNNPNKVNYLTVQVTRDDLLSKIDSQLFLTSEVKIFAYQSETEIKNQFVYLVTDKHCDLQILDYVNDNAPSPLIGSSQ